MKMIQEVQNGTSSIQIIATHKTEFLRQLLHALRTFKAELVTTDKIPSTYEDHDVYIFIQNPHVLLQEFDDKTDKRFIFILFDQDTVAQTMSSFAYERNLHHIKIINLQTKPSFYPKDIDTILWFSFSNPEDIFLHIYHPEMELRSPEKKVVKKNTKPWFTWPKRKRTWALLIFVFLFISHILFIPPLLIGSYLNYKQAATSFESKSLAETSTTTQAWLNMSKILYRYAGPTLHLFAIARPFDNLFEINDATASVLDASDALARDGSVFLDLMMVKNKTRTEVEELRNLKTTIFQNVKQIQDDIRILEQKIPKYDRFEGVSEKLQEYNRLLPLITEMEPHIDTFFPLDGEKKYVLFFANNMELRPGGGFIGSFAIVKVGPYEIRDIRVYDVYDADGQLTEHLAPPVPISQFLGQPFWFLRDSAFTPDFVTNFQEAEKLLEKEIQEGNFAGGMLFTTTAVQNMLAASDGLYIPDYDETITKDNFYLKAQLYAEKDFFPGSIQKKRFLGSVMNQMLINLSNVSLADLMTQIEKSLNEKQMVVYSREPVTQAYLEKNFWSGRTLKPKCNLPQAMNCILDYVFPLDANLGVNKANFFVSRPTRMNIKVNDNGTIENTVTLAYTNNSYDDIFPGGEYKNYFQLMLPPNSRVNSIRVDDAVLTDIDETNFEYKVVGFLLRIPPQTSQIVTINYTLPTSIITGEGMYQLIFQKQIGSANDNLQLEFDLPTNVSIVNNNFSPLVKDNKILYNTSISSDKIFLIEFSKN